MPGGNHHLAETFSRVTHPLSFICLTLFLINWKTQHSLLYGIVDTALLVLCLVPSIVYLASTRTTRPPARKPIAITLLLLGVALTAAMYSVKGSSTFQVNSLVIGMLGALGITFIHRRWNMSFHAATSMGCAALLVPIAPTLAVLMALLAVITGLARLPIGAHTPLQILAGWTYGFGVTSLLLMVTT